MVDRRAGSANLLPYLHSLLVPAKLTTLPFGDASWIGRGPDDRPVTVGVEVKAPGDLLDSLRTGRLTGHQLEGLLSRYEVVYLLIEGYMKRGKAGRLAWDGRKTYGQWEYDEIRGRLATLRNKMGVRIEYTRTRRGSAEWIASEFKWWTGRPWEAHRSHLQEHRLEDAEDPAEWYRKRNGGYARRVRVARELADGVGLAKARQAAEHFRTVREMVEAGPKEWMKVKGIGRGLVRRIEYEVGREE